LKKPEPPSSKNCIPPYLDDRDPLKLAMMRSRKYMFTTVMATRISDVDAEIASKAITKSGLENIEKFFQ